MSDALFLFHAVAGSFVTVLMFAFAVTINVQRKLLRHRDDRITGLRRVLAAYRASAARPEQGRIRAQFESECG